MRQAWLQTSHGERVNRSSCWRTNSLGNEMPIINQGDLFQCPSHRFHAAVTADGHGVLAAIDSLAVAESRVPQFPADQPACHMWPITCIHFNWCGWCTPCFHSYPTCDSRSSRCCCSSMNSITKMLRPTTATPPLRRPQCFNSQSLRFNPCIFMSSAAAAAAACVSYWRRFDLIALILSILFILTHTNSITIPTMPRNKSFRRFAQFPFVRSYFFYFVLLSPVSHF